MPIILLCLLFQWNCYEWKKTKANAAMIDFASLRNDAYYNEYTLESSITNGYDMNSNSQKFKRMYTTHRPHH